MDGGSFGSFFYQKIIAPDIENVPPGNFLIVILDSY